MGAKGVRGQDRHLWAKTQSFLVGLISVLTFYSELIRLMYIDDRGAVLS